MAPAEPGEDLLSGEEEKEEEPEEQEEQGKGGEGEEQAPAAEPVALTPEILKAVWESPEYTERLGQATRAALMQAQATEQARREAAAEEEKYAALAKIEDEDERAEKLAELGAETLQRREAERTERAVRDRYMTGLFAELRQAWPELNNLTNDESERLSKESTDAGILSTLADIRANRLTAARLEGLKAMANQKAAQKNRESPVSLPGARPGSASSVDDLKHPERILSEAFNEAITDSLGVEK